MTLPIAQSEAGIGPDKFVTVGKYIDSVDAHMARGMLESAGIECFLQGENANNLLGAAFRARLLVHKQDEAAAREILGTPDNLDPEDDSSE
ncbi:putative signal transducing protein [Edaphobacter aggregans]|jgi:hypothetical protein|uniref:Putative signal transducing protein n=1 Tax=Edaphobacter aggregans TaxID=570835 RepID=A0A3R9WIK7_9BACT|nr:DUF2007 domain-containing protein [Edaphobacter aggregans]RSL18040.1 putative signal transducing protein [Edaphobacter aggregans]